jgi:ornithine--oxo-acid transaminase
MQSLQKNLWQTLAEEGVQEAVAALSDAEVFQMTEAYGTHNYKPLAVNPVRGEGVKVWDQEGNLYFDCIGAYSAVAHGHLSPFVVDTLRRQLDLVTVTSRAFYSSEVALFLKALCEYAELDMACPMNTGAEANETAIKLARKWAYTVKGVPEDQAEIIVCQDNFHGRTTTIVGFSTEDQYKKHFGPFTPGFKVIPFNDLAALEEAITPNTAAFLVEPIQAEGGILIPDDGWMAKVRELCTKNNVLLIWDEVQTGFCRTGRKFAWMYEDAKPDIMAVGKPLGGGILPVSAAIGKKEVMEVFVPGDHGSTFGGNPLGSVVALAAMTEMEVKDFCGKSEVMGARLTDGLRSLPFSCIKEVRSRGLLIGLEVEEGTDTKALSKALTAQRVLTKETRNRTFRYTPPIVISEAEIDEILNRTEAAFRSALG